MTIQDQTRANEVMDALVRYQFHPIAQNLTTWIYTIPGADNDSMLVANLCTNEYQSASAYYAARMVFVYDANRIPIGEVMRDVNGTYIVEDSLQGFEETLWDYIYEFRDVCTHAPRGI